MIVSLPNSRSPAESSGSELIHGLGICETQQVFLNERNWSHPILDIGNQTHSVSMRINGEPNKSVTEKRLGYVGELEIHPSPWFYAIIIPTYEQFLYNSELSGSKRDNVRVRDDKPWLTLDCHAKNHTEIQIFGFRSDAEINIRLSVDSIEMTL